MKIANDFVTYFDGIKILIVEGTTVSLNPVRIGMELIKSVFQTTNELVSLL